MLRGLLCGVLGWGIAAGQCSDPQTLKTPVAPSEDSRKLYLEGRALTGKDTPKAIPLLQRAAADPAMPWAHLVLAEIYASPNFKDERSLLEAMRAFRKLCPANLEGFRYLNLLKEPGETQRWAGEFRALLERQIRPEHGRYWQMLWGAEFRVTAEAGHPELRRRVAADVTRLEAFPRNRELIIALIDGYRLLGRPEAAAKMEAEIGGDDTAAFKEHRAWEEKRGLRTRNSPMTAEERLSLAREQAKMAAEWIEKWPASRFAWMLRLSTLPFTEGWTKEDLERTGERALELSRGRVPEAAFYDQLRVALVWIRHGVRLEDSVRIAEEALAHFARGPEVPSDLTADRNAMLQVEGQRYGFDSSAWDAMGGVMDAALQLKDLAKARAMHTRMREWLAANESRRPVQGSGFAGFERLETVYAGKLAEAEGRDLDALGYYAKAVGSGWVRDEVVEHARKLWIQRGGSAEAWERLVTRPAPLRPAAGKEAPPASPAPSLAAFERTEKPLPAFRLRDMAGRVWSLDDLKGKRTFVNVWATWCWPCREEFPHLQKLYELTKDRKDILVLTLNVDDENPGLVEPFVAGYKVTFPVVLGAREYVMGFSGFLGIPQNWLVDRNGVLRAKSHGFDASTKDWVARILEQLEQLP